MNKIKDFHKTLSRWVNVNGHWIALEYKDKHGTASEHKRLKMLSVSPTVREVG